MQNRERSEHLPEESNGNLNPAEHRKDSGGLKRSLAPIGRSIEKGCRMAPFFYGAGNGNRTRVASLGSWSFTIRLYPRMHILYTIFSNLSSPILREFGIFSEIFIDRILQKFQSEPDIDRALCFPEMGGGIGLKRRGKGPASPEKCRPRFSKENQSKFTK